MVEQSDSSLYAFLISLVFLGIVLVWAIDRAWKLWTVKKQPKPTGDATTRSLSNVARKATNGNSTFRKTGTDD